MPKIIKILSLFLLIAASSFSFVHAQERAFTAEYVYAAGKLDDRATARVLALEGVKDRLWRKLWDDLDGLVLVKQLNLTAEQMAAVVPSLAEVLVVDERWDGRTYRVEAELFVGNLNSLQQSLLTLSRDEGRLKELAEGRKRREDALGRMAVLNAEATTAPGGAKEGLIGRYRLLARQLSESDLMLKGSIAERSGRWREAKKAYDEALKLNPRNESALYRRGIASAQMGMRNDALRDFNRVLKANPESDSALYMRGIVYARMGKYRQAVADLSRAIKRNDRFAPAYYQRAMALDRLGKTGEAVEDLTRAIELNGENSQYYLTRGALLEKLGRRVEASQDLTRAVKLDQKHELTAAGPLDRSSKDNQAVKELAEAIAKNPTDSEAYYRRGMFYSNIGDCLSAVSDFNKAIELNPKDAASYFMRGVTYGMIDLSYDSLKDIRVSARLGYKPAREYMSARGLKW
ncbi:MAG TPA: tetratricopeptide repeat protein [Syntrophales bacterium]|nr:tetratricopeptide repeat protein [Syntrophales bacterium]HRT27104.1 tetratricopeptide repeat protein [Syntrophales bacterium]HRT70899.1 tetratricopeptide repeat protein [Syntrophales bacterium]